MLFPIVSEAAGSAELDDEIEGVLLGVVPETAEDDDVVIFRDWWRVICVIK